MSQTTAPPPAPPAPPTEGEDGGGRDPVRFDPRPPLWATLTRWLLLLLGVGGLFFLATRLAAAGLWVPVVFVAMAALAALAIYSTRRAIPAKYLYPGLLLLLALQIWPLLFTIGMSFTNYGSGYLQSKDEAVASIVENSTRPVEGAPRYQMAYAVPEGETPSADTATLLLTDPDGAVFAGDAGGLTPLDAGAVTLGDTGRVEAAEGYTLLSAIEVGDVLEDAETGLVVPSEDGEIRPLGLSQAFVGEPSLVHDPAADTITDTTTGVVYTPQDANYVPADGEGDPLPQGWTEGVGFDNYTQAFTDETLRNGFIGQAVWNFAFAALSVLTTFVLGLALALLFNDPRLRGKAFYRSVLILPYAIPVYVSALVWASMFNQDFGLINQVTGLGINWLGDPWMAKLAILLTNLWLGFPYMFIVCTGALQAIPGDVREAAAMDGASWFRTVRSVVTPLLLVAVGPLLIASFAFNFNNFGLIFLLTEGGPFVGGQAQIGSTDLLITIAYRLAFTGTTPNFGFAAAIAVLIFFLTAVISAVGFRRTRALEDVN